MKSYPECKSCKYKNTTKCDSCTTYDRERMSESRSDDSFLTSAVVAAATDSTLLGFMAGGDLLGSMIGDSLFGDD